MIHIRAFKPSDRDFITSLVMRFSEFDLPAWRSRSEVDHINRVTLQKAIDQPEPDSAIFIAEDESGRAAGFIYLQTQVDYFNAEKHGYISDLAVDKSFEGQGVGRALMNKAEEWARQHGYGLLTLYVFAGNKRAQLLYEKNGFQQEVIKYAKMITQDATPGSHNREVTES
jgi:ribosomal protein S18 acetylase RimI-like enzyme